MTGSRRQGSERKEKKKKKEGNGSAVSGTAFPASGERGRTRRASRVLMETRAVFRRQGDVAACRPLLFPI